LEWKYGNVLEVNYGNALGWECSNTLEWKYANVLILSWCGIPMFDCIEKNIEPIVQLVSIQV